MVGFFQNIWCALFSCNARFDIRPFALLPTKRPVAQNGLNLLHDHIKSVFYHSGGRFYLAYTMNFRIQKKLDR